MSKLILPKNRNSLLQSFLTRYSPSSLPLTPTSQPTPFASTSSNPFAPTKTPGSRSSTAPKFSIRRQKVLRKEVELLGWPIDVLPVSYLKATKAELRGTPSIGSATYKAVPHLPSTKILDGLNLEKKGPYLGRKGASFKGKIWERKMNARQTELKEALLKAPAKEAAWRKGLADDKVKAKASIPFQ